MTQGEFGPMGDAGDIAEPWRRLAGFALDWIALVMISLVIVSLMGIDLGGSSALRLPTSARLVQGLVGALYYVGFTVVRGQTPGKMLTGTKVVMQATVEIPGIGPATLRWLIPGVFVFLPGVSVISGVVYGWLLFDSLRRGLHDKAAKTVVVRAY
ncbi:MAG: RDD family protein [Acidimicrobiia bacterium]|nr:MAG: RDD family protein [Acidimicrobiia bacterium]